MKKIVVLSSLLLGVVFLAGCGQQPVSQTKQTTPVPVVQQPAANQPVATQPADESVNWKVFANTQYGLEFKYPETWTVTESGENGSDYKVIAKIVNPARAGKIDTGVPIEQFIVRSQNIACGGQSPISLGGKTGTDSGWSEGYGSIYYRDLCFKTQEWPVTIALSAFDESSQKVLDKIFSTFKFTK